MTAFIRAHWDAFKRHLMLHRTWREARQRRRQIFTGGLQGRERADCDGPLPCTTCADKRGCGRTGCIRQKALA